MEAAATPLQSVSRKESEGVEGKKGGADSFKLAASTFSRASKHAKFVLFKGDIAFYSSLGTSWIGQRKIANTP